jgi:hypothetical protein
MSYQKELSEMREVREDNPEDEEMEERKKQEVDFGCLHCLLDDPVQRMVKERSFRSEKTKGNRNRRKGKEKEK